MKEEPSRTSEPSLPNLHPLVQFGAGVVVSILSFAFTYVLAMVSNYSWVALPMGGIAIGVMGPWAILGALVVVYSAPGPDSAFGGIELATGLLILGALAGLAIRVMSSRTTMKNI